MRKASEIETAFSPTDSLDGRRSFFLVGIGGAGMGALARMLAHRGFAVRGADATAGPETGRLAEEGVAVRIGHSGEGLTGDDALVVTDAVDLDASPEVARARELGIPVVRRSQALGWVLRPYRTICVTGTHGKTTTTGMIGAGLIAAGLDPTVVVGAAIPQWGGPVREGKGEWAVVEACEAYDSFHDLRPDMVVLTNLELDHVDFHGTWENLRDSVARFVKRLDESQWGGDLIYCGEDEGAREIGNASAEGEGCFQVTPYDSRTHSEALQGMALSGNHNRLNASGALTACVEAGADPVWAAKGISAFTGAERRLQLLHDCEIKVYDDYAHHPTEIEASLKALRERGIGVPPMRPTGVPPVTQEAEKRQGAYLPHWRQEGGTYDVAFRLADAVPRSVQEEWRSERERFEKVAEATMSVRDRLEYTRLLRQKVDDYLDAGHGECLLRDDRPAGIVAGALAHFDGSRYLLHAWCVMPNHVHAVLTPLEGHDLSQILHSWKSFTSHEINKALGRQGTRWQPEPYDHVVRNDADFDRVVRYVLDNPSKARLKDWRWVGEGHGRDARETHRRDADATPGRLIVVYQPHLYSRTAPLIDEFAAALSHADLVVLTDIYPAREPRCPA